MVDPGHPSSRPCISGHIPIYIHLYIYTIVYTIKQEYTIIYIVYSYILYIYTYFIVYLYIYYIVYDTNLGDLSR